MSFAHDLQDSATKSKGKKVSAAVAAIQREVEERRKAEDAARQAQEEKQRAEEEARLQEELEARRREEAEVARAEAKRLEREKLRREGKLLTTKQRAKAKRLAAQRDVFIARAQVGPGSCFCLFSMRTAQKQVIGFSLATSIDAVVSSSGSGNYNW